MNTHSSIEHLEARIAPATLAGNILTYTDIDGDAVKIVFTHATMDPTDFVFSTGTVNDGSDTPRTLTSITMAGKTGGGFTLTAIPHAGKGDSHANIDSISGGGTDLGVISVDGNVRSIGAGSGTVGTVGLKSFTALSMGATGANSSLLKNVGSFIIKGDVSDETLNFSGSIKKLTIGGDLVETLDNTVAAINIAAQSTIGALTIGGSIIARSGGQPNLSFGLLSSPGTLKIGGSIVGGTKALAGNFQIDTHDALKSFTLGHDLIGGSAEGGGSMRIGHLVTLKIGGSIIAQDDVFTNGYVVLAGDVGTVSVGGNVRAGDLTGSAGLNLNGAIAIQGTFSSVTIGGDFIGSHRFGSGDYVVSNGLYLSGAGGKVTIGGSIQGDRTKSVTIEATGGGTTGAAMAIKTLTIKGSAQYTNITAGTPDVHLPPYNTDSGIGSVTIGGSFVASNILAGSAAGVNGIFGDSDDVAVAGSLATIGSVKIGRAFNGVAGSNTVYTISAPQINKLTVGKATSTHAALQSGVLFYAIGLAGALSDH